MFNAELQTGDVFVVNSESIIAGLINSVSGFNSTDGESTYNHAGVIVTDGGVTFEALRVLDYSTLKSYLGQQILIARPDATYTNQILAMETLAAAHRGQKYPWWRIALHIYPPFARMFSYKGKWVVCSELVAKYEYLLGLRGEEYTGVTPDKLSEEWKHWKDFEIVFEGTLALKEQ